ncbi:MAG: ABC transporter permease [Lachnospiraceae bacterium]
MNQDKKKSLLVDNPIVNGLKNNMGIIAVLIIMCVIVSFATDKFLTSNNMISVLRQISINTYIALGMTLVIILGNIDLSVGSIVAMNGTLTVGLIVNQGVPVGVAILIGLALGTFAGFANGFIVSIFKVPSFIITMAMMNIASGIAYVYSGGQSTRITQKFFIAIGTGYLFDTIPLPVVYMVLLIALFSFLLSKTKFGTYIYAIGGNREAARLSGVPIRKVEMAVFTITGLLSAFAGLVLCSRMYSGQPSVGSGYELDAIAACVLGGTSMAGGKGRISGTVFGAMVIGIISNGLNLIGVSSYWQLIVKGLIIICAVLLDGQKGKVNFLRKKVRKPEQI